MSPFGKEQKLSSLTAANRKPHHLPVLLLPFIMLNMYDMSTHFLQGLTMMTRKSIDTALLSVAADKLSLREWDWIILM